MTTSKNAATAGALFPTALSSAEDFGKLIEDLKLPGLDVEALMDWQRKDMEALTEAGRQAFEGIQSLARRRGEILQEMLAQWQDALKDATGTGALSKQSDAAQRAVQQALDFRELAQLETQLHNDSWKVVQDRLNENMVKLQLLLQPKK